MSGNSMVTLWLVVPSDKVILLLTASLLTKPFISAYKTPSASLNIVLSPALLHTSANRVTVLPFVGMYDVGYEPSSTCTPQI